MSRIVEIRENTDGKVNFYGKSFWLVIGDTRYMVSYNTIVGTMYKGGILRRHIGKISPVTNKHLRCFLTDKQYEKFKRLPVSYLGDIEPRIMLWRDKDGCYNTRYGWKEG